ncbi:MAG: phBC6A51 family helix-turn-helix protein [Janthinobacterium lividum]
MASKQTTSQSADPAFAWTQQTEQAAFLVAEGKFAEAKIAAKLKIDRTTLWRWKKHPEFSQRVQESVAALRQAIREEGIAVLENRVQRLNADWAAMQALRDARAQDARETRISNKKAVEDHIVAAKALGADESQLKKQVAEIERGLPHIAPGMETGLLVRGYKVSGGAMFQEFTFDAALLRELRGHEEQVAKELGQWTEKKEITGKDGGPVEVTVKEVGLLSDEELRQRLAETRAKKQAEAAALSELSEC